MTFTLLRVTINRLKVIRELFKRRVGFDWIFVGFIITIAFSLRFYLAYSSQEWIDKVTVVHVSYTNSHKDLLLLNHWDVAHPPLLYIYNRLLIQLNNWQLLPWIILRLPFVFVSSLAVIPLYFLTKKLLPNVSKLIYFVVILTYAISPYQIRAGYSMKPYNLLQFLMPIACFAFFYYPFKNRKQFLFFNLLFIFLFYWDYASTWFFFPFFVSLVLTYGVKNIPFLIKNYFLFFIASILWIPLFIIKFNNALILANYLEVNLQEIILNLSGVFVHNEFKQLSFVVLVILIGIAFYKVFKLNKPTFTFMLSGFFLPVIIAALFSYTVSPIAAHTNLLYSSLILIILSGYLLTFQNKKYLVLGLVTWFSLVIYSYFLPPLSYSYSNVHIASVPSQLSLDASQTNSFLYKDCENKHPLNILLPLYLIQQGFKPINNSSNTFAKNEQVFIVNLRNICEHKKNLRNEQGVTENRFFIVNSDSQYSDSDQKEINQTCPSFSKKSRDKKDSSNFFLFSCKE